MAQEKFEWTLMGDCVEGCTSPPVCPAYWMSPLQAQVHDGKSWCQGVWNFDIKEGYLGNIDLSGLRASLVFNTSEPFPPARGTEAPWKSIIFIDEKANAEQAAALERIYRECWADMGDVVAVKRGKIEFNKELVDSGPCLTFAVHIEGVYDLQTRPFRTADGKPRYINSFTGGLVNVGRSTVNRLRVPDPPAAGKWEWDAPGMSITYYPFILTPKKHAWIP